MKDITFVQTIKECGSTAIEQVENLTSLLMSNCRAIMKIDNSENQLETQKEIRNLITGADL